MADELVNTDEEQKEEQLLDPEDYFSNLKSKRQETTDEYLDNLYASMEVLLRKAFAMGQIKMVRKLLFALDVLEKERTLYQHGFRTFIYRDDVEYYMDKVTSKAVKIIKLEDYPREIPDEVAQKLLFLREKNIFDTYYVVFTDYTGKLEREVAVEDRRKDPIIFGAFCKRDPHNRILHDRFYYIADWEDEYCDLTLDKMVSEMAKAGKFITHKIHYGSNLNSIRQYVNSLDDKKEKGVHRFKSNFLTSFTRRIKLFTSER